MFKAAIVFALSLSLLPGMVFNAHSQEKKENVFLHPQKFYDKYLPGFKIKYKPSDSNYIKTYPRTYMTVGLRVFSPEIRCTIEPQGVSQAASDLRTNIRTITGFSFSYRHITAGFALSVLPPLGDPADFADTYYRTATVKYKSPIYILTFKFMKIKGVTDVNAFNSMDPGRSNTPRSDITIKEYLFEGIYNFSWKKYSYLSTVDYTESQIKSHIGFLLKSGIYNQQLFCDTNLLSMPQREYFKDFDHVSKIVGYNIKLSPGIGGTFVIKKHLYFSCAVFSPLNIYVNRLYSNADELVHKEASLQWVVDGSASVGYHAQRFYAALRCEVDGRTAAFHSYAYTSVYNYFGIDIGYRFNAPSFIQKFYKDTMPPGM